MVKSGHAVYICFNLPGSEESPSLARGIPDDVGRTGRLVDLPAHGLAFLAAIGNLFADTTLQLVLLGVSFAEIT